MTEKKIYQADWVPNAQQNTPSYDVLCDELENNQHESDTAIEDQVQRLIEQWLSEKS